MNIPEDVPPGPARVLLDVLETTAELSVRQALMVEAFAYSTLLAGPDFASWRAQTERRRAADTEHDPVRVERADDQLRVVLDRPARHNAFGHVMRDSLVDALEMVRLDSSIRAVELVGSGPSFCSGGDLDEFGTTPDVVTAYLVRMERHPGLLVHELRDRVRPLLHGACIGAGMEIPAFASHVRASRDAWFQLPELRMGLIPGAGGTVSIPRRIGSERTAWLALSGERIDASTALAWGLVDELV